MRLAAPDDNACVDLEEIVVDDLSLYSDMLSCEMSAKLW